jgi:ABC-type Fe3+-hydroxamate transport system substrate-binding protein
MKTRHLRLLTALVGAALVLTACGTTEQPADPTGAAAITLVDDRGETIELAGPATRVVGLEWNAVENLVALGVMPVGVADPAGYGSWVKATPLVGDVTDVGMRGEPSLDAIAGLAPELVIATNDLADSVISQIEAFAPVLVLRGADASNGIGQMTKNINAIATATGTQVQAAELVAGFEEKLAQGRAAIETAGMTGEPFVFSDAWAEGGQVYIRAYFQGSLISDVTEELGLVNAWEGEGDADYGLGATDLEGLTTLGDVHFIYLGSEEQDAYANELAANPIWTSLPFVSSGKVHRLPNGIWPFGGPSSINDYIDAVLALLV